MDTNLIASTSERDLSALENKIHVHVICTYWLSGRAGRENIWSEVMAYEPSAKYLLSRPDLNSVNKHFIIWALYTINEHSEFEVWTK